MVLYGMLKIWNSMKGLSKSGVNEIDLEGINSLRRWLFKLSFGGRPVPHYHVSYQK